MTGERCGGAVTELELRALLEAHHRAGFACALSCCAFNVVEAEDVLQSVYGKILQGDAVYRGEAAFRTWLFAVIRNTAAQERRRSFWQRRRIVEDETLLDSAQVDDDASDRVYRAEMQTQGDQLRTEIRNGDEETRRHMRVLHEEVISRLALLQEGLPASDEGAATGRRRRPRKSH